MPASSNAPAAIGVFPPSVAQQLREIVRQPPALHGIERSRWRLRDLSTALTCLRCYSLPGLSQALKRLKIRRKRGRLSVTSPDLAYERKLDWIDRAVALARACPDEVVVLYGDEYTLVRQPKLGDVWAGPGPEPRACLTHQVNYTYRYSAAIDVVGGRVVWTGELVMGVRNLRRFLKAVRKAFPGKRVFLIWDNWPIHLHPAVLTEATDLDIGLLWLPTYAPWTNPIEKLWRKLVEDLLRHHRLADHWKTLKQKVADFLDQFANGSGDLLRYVGLLPD